MEKQLITEVNRIREMMGLSLLSEQVTSTTKKVFKALGFSDDAIEATAKNVDFGDLTKLSDEFTSLGIKNMDDWQSSLSAKGVDLLSASDSQIMKLIDETPGLKSALEAAYTKAVKETTDSLTKALTLPASLVTNLKSIASTKLTDLNKNIVSQTIEKQLEKVDDIIDDLVKKSIAVPDELNKLKNFLISKKSEAMSFNPAKAADDAGTPSPSSRFVGDVDGGDIPTPIINGGYKVGDDPDFDSIFKLGIDGAGVKLTDSQIDTVRQAIWVATKDLNNINISNLQKQIAEAAQRLANSSDQISRTRGKKLLEALKKLPTCGIKQLSYKTLWQAPGCFLGWVGAITAISAGADFMGINNNVWKKSMCTLLSIADLNVLGDIWTITDKEFYQEMCVEGDQEWWKDSSSNKKGGLTPQIKDKITSWFNGLTGAGQDLEGATNLSITVSKDTNGNPIPDTFDLTYSVGGTSQAVKVKIINGEIVPQ